MNKPKFTKGPWRVNNYIHGFNISFGDDELVTDYVCEFADAHLIACAPDMYRMLERWVNMLESTNIAKESKELLAKARGEL